MSGKKSLECLLDSLKLGFNVVHDIPGIAQPVFPAGLFSFQAKGTQPGIYLASYPCQGMCYYRDDKFFRENEQG